MKVKLPSRMVYFKLGRSFAGGHSREVLNGIEEVEGVRLDTEDEGAGDGCRVRYASTFTWGCTLKRWKGGSPDEEFQRFGLEYQSSDPCRWCRP
jgi:hypothetical protein